MSNDRNKDLEIRVLTMQDSRWFPMGVALLNRTQGCDLFAADYLAVKTESENAIVVAVFREDKIVGVGVSEVITDFSYYTPFVPRLAEELRTKTVGSFSTLAILESLQGRGLGQILSRVRIRWLRDQGCNVVLGVSWVSGLAHTSNRVFEKMGFKAVKRVENFYHQQSIDKPFFCPGCQLAPCTCAAILYRLDLE